MFTFGSVNDRKHYLAGHVATFVVNTVRGRGEPTSFSSPTIKVLNKDKTSIILVESDMVKAPEGFFFFDWDIPETLSAGDYWVIFSSELDGQIIERSQLIKIVEDKTKITNSQVVNAKRETELSIGLFYLIKSAQEIPVEYELGRIKPNRVTVNFTFPNWNKFYNRLTIYRNNEEVTSGYEISYEKGQVTFDSALLNGEFVHADYNFSWFNGEEMSAFLYLALQEVNVMPPGSNRNLGNAPELWFPAIIYGGARNALRRLIFDLSYQQNKLVYGFPEGFDTAIENFKTLKENYEQDFQEMAKWAKRYKWPKIGLIIAPEFTMPGGRSRWFRFLFT